MNHTCISLQVQSESDPHSNQNILHIHNRPHGFLHRHQSRNQHFISNPLAMASDRTEMIARQNYAVSILNHRKSNTIYIIIYLNHLSQSIPYNLYHIPYTYHLCLLPTPTLYTFTCIIILNHLSTTRSRTSS